MLRPMPDPTEGTPHAPTPNAIHDYRARLTRGENVIDPDAWAGAIPAASGISPRLRVGKNRWFNVLWLVPLGFALLVCAIAAAKGLREMPSVQAFIARHPGIGYAVRFDRPMPAWL